MSSVVVDETCACGARFLWRGDAIYSGSAMSDWRSTHRHTKTAAVGICGEGNEIQGPNPTTAICNLPAGHAGWHKSESPQVQWGYPRWTACDGHPCAFCATTPDATLTEPTR